MVLFSCNVNYRLEAYRKNVYHFCVPRNGGDIDGKGTGKL